MVPPPPGAAQTDNNLKQAFVYVAKQDYADHQMLFGNGGGQAGVDGGEASGAKGGLPQSAAEPIAAPPRGAPPHKADDRAVEYAGRPRANAGPPVAQDEPDAVLTAPDHGGFVSFPPRSKDERRRRT